MVDSRLRVRCDQASYAWQRLLDCSFLAIESNCHPPSTCLWKCYSCSLRCLGWNYRCLRCHLCATLSSRRNHTRDLDCPAQTGFSWNTYQTVSGTKAYPVMYPTFSFRSVHNLISDLEFLPSWLDYRNFHGYYLTPVSKEKTLRQLHFYLQHQVLLLFHLHESHL